MHNFSFTGHDGKMLTWFAKPRAGVASLVHPKELIMYLYQFKISINQIW